LRRGSFASILLLGAAALRAAPSPSEEAVRLFLENKPREALPFLEEASKSPSASEDIRLYLGLAYEQLGRRDEAIAALKKGLPYAKDYPYLFQYGIGNSYFAQGKMAFAEEYYGLAIAAKPEFGQAYLNRANARLNQGKYDDALADYGRFLLYEPSSPKRPEVERIMEAIRGLFAEQEAIRKAEEAARQAEEQRRKELLAEIERSLRDAAAEMTNLSGGSEDVKGYEDEFTLED